MVGGGDRIEELHQNQVNELLRDYKERKVVAEVLHRKDEELDFLDECIGCFEPHERDLIVKTCVEGVSLREYARQSGVSRDTLSKERKKLLAFLGRIFCLREAALR